MPLIAGVNFGDLFADEEFDNDALRANNPQARPGEAFNYPCGLDPVEMPKGCRASVSSRARRPCYREADGIAGVRTAEHSSQRGSSAND